MLESRVCAVRGCVDSKLTIPLTTRFSTKRPDGILNEFTTYMKYGEAIPVVLQSKQKSADFSAASGATHVFAFVYPLHPNGTLNEIEIYIRRILLLFYLSK